jgi:hypothetical protein
MFPLINIKDIFNAQYKTLKEDANWFNLYIPFYLLPILLSLSLIKFVGIIAPKIASSIAGILAILGGFLFNSLLILLDLMRKEKKKTTKAILRLKLLKRVLSVRVLDC